MVGYCGTLLLLLLSFLVTLVSGQSLTWAFRDDNTGTAS